MPTESLSNATVSGMQGAVTLPLGDALFVEEPRAKNNRKAIYVRLPPSTSIPNWLTEGPQYTIEAKSPSGFFRQGYFKGTVKLQDSTYLKFEELVVSELEMEMETGMDLSASPGHGRWYRKGDKIIVVLGA